MSTTREYRLGQQRGRATGHEEPTDRDWQWLADETDGEVQTDPDGCADFAAGMRDGAADDATDLCPVAHTA